MAEPVSFRRPSVWLATWFGCGLMKPAPGTWGTLGALPFAVFMMKAGGWPLLLAGIIVVTIVGYWAANHYEAMSGKHDSSEIVIDEVAGVWIALLPAVFTPLSFAIGFLLFRLFDIIKPWPVGWADKKLPGALGVMADDVLAGLIAAVLLWALRIYAGIG